MLRLALGYSGQFVVFTDQVLGHFSQYQQTRFWHREAGGQLFGTIADLEILVNDITGPRKTDRRHRTLYLPDRRSEQSEIEERFPHGLHFVGDWHTHPEPMPTPSARDLQSMSECVRRSKHNFNAFLLVIVGSAAIPYGLHISLHSGSEVLLLHGSAY